MASSLARRIAVAAVGIPAAGGLVLVGGWPLVIALQLLAILGTWELYRLAAQRDVVPLAGLGYVGAAATPVLAYAVTGPDPLEGHWIAYAAVGWLVLVMATTVSTRRPDERPLATMAVTVFGPLYTALLPSFLLVIRHGADRSATAQTALVFLPLVVTWLCDTAAMGGGAAFGGPKFAPVVSPNKTWAGTISGSLAGTVIAPVYGWLVLARVGIHLAWWQLAVIGFVLAGVGQVGDLTESLLKREAGVKDSGRAFPGHGGVLDRLDSLYWVLPTAALLLTAYQVI